MLSTAAYRVRRRQRGQELGGRSSGLGRGLMCLSCYETSAVASAPGAVSRIPAAPITVEGMLYPLHPLQVTAMGMFAADSLQLEDLSQACAEEGRFDFMVVGLPLRLPGGTGSPWNPIAIF
jgi:hypothetical protein